MVIFSDLNRKLIDLVEGKKVELDNTTLRKVLNYSKYNKIFAAVVQSLKNSRVESKVLLNEIKDLLVISERNIRQQRRTLRGIKKVLDKGGIPYLVARTKRTMIYVTYDIDIIVRPEDFDRAVHSFGEESYVIKKHGTINGINPQWQRTAQAKNELLIDIHKNVSWLGSQYISVDDIWRDTSYSDVVGIRCPVPSATTELLLVCANALFEKFHLTILDYLYLNDLYGKCDKSLARAITERYKWYGEYRALMQYIKMVRSSKHLEVGIKNIFGTSDKTIFPVVIPFKNVCWLLGRRLLAGRGISFLSVFYVINLNGKMWRNKSKFFPYYVSWD